MIEICTRGWCRSGRGGRSVLLGRVRRPAPPCGALSESLARVAREHRPVDVGRAGALADDVDREVRRRGEDRTPVVAGELRDSRLAERLERVPRSCIAVARTAARWTSTGRSATPTTVSLVECRHHHSYSSTRSSATIRRHPPRGPRRRAGAARTARSGTARARARRPPPPVRAHPCDTPRPHPRRQPRPAPSRTPPSRPARTVEPLQTPGRCLPVESVLRGSLRRGSRVDPW